MGRNELLKGKVLTEDELLERINSVTIEEVNQVASHIFDLSRCRFPWWGRS